MVNKTWSILFQRANMERGDWLRICPDGLSGVGDTSIHLAEVMFPFPDPNVRGWVVEAAIQLALRSSHGETILSLDPHNTYDAPLVGKHCFFEVAKGWAVTSTAVNRSLSRYHQSAIVSLNPDTGAYAVQGADGSSLSGTATPIGRTYTLPFTSSSMVEVTLPFDENLLTPDPGNGNAVLFTVKGRVLPHGPAARLVKDGLTALYDGGFIPSSDDTLVEQTGAAVLHLLRGTE